MGDPVLLVGESNPYGADPDFALYPSPEGSAGWRLCVDILGMQRSRYLATFARVNLCAGRWSIREARARAADLRATAGNIVLLGSKVAAAFGYAFDPFSFRVEVAAVYPLVVPRQVAILPHPSGRCRLWNEPDAVANARRAVAMVCAEYVAPGVEA